MPLPLDPNPEQSTVNKSKWGGIRKVVALPSLDGLLRVCKAMLMREKCCDRRDMIIVRSAFGETSRNVSIQARW